MSRGTCAIILVLCLHGALALLSNPRTLKSKVLHRGIELAEREVLEEIRLRGPELKDNRPTIQAVDLRGSNLRPVENQGSCGSCVAFGTVHTIQDNFRFCGLAKLSTQHVLNCRLSCKNGGYISNAYFQLAFPGITHEGCMRYRATDGWCSWLGLISYCDNGAVATQTVQRTSTCTSAESTMRSWLDIGRPFTIGMGLMYKFYDHGNAVVARDSVYPRATGDSRYLGGHAMEVVGYGDLNGVGYWLVKNSWGNGWGDGGFFKLRRKPYFGFFGLFGTEYFGTVCRPWHTGYCPVYAAVGEHAEIQGERQVDPEGRFVVMDEGDTDPQQIGEKNATDLDPNAPVPGGGGPLDKNHPLVREAAFFAVHVLLATPKLEGGYECVPELPIREDVNTSVSGRSMDEAAAQAEVLAAVTTVTVHNADQRVTGGVSIRFLFTFSNSDARCASGMPGGTFDATVYVSQDGYLIMQTIFRSSPPEEGEGINVGAVVGGSVAAFVVVAAIGTYGALRWRATRHRYKKLKDIHQEVITKVDQLEQGPAGDAIRAAALSTVLKSSAEFRSSKGSKGSNPVKLHMKPKDESTSSTTAV